MKMMNQVTNAETSDPDWKNLYRVGGVAALIAGLLAIIDIIILVIWPNLAPSTVGSRCFRTIKNYKSRIRDA